MQGGAYGESRQRKAGCAGKAGIEGRSRGVAVGQSGRSGLEIILRYQRSIKRSDATVLV